MNITTAEAPNAVPAPAHEPGLHAGPILLAVGGSTDCTAASGAAASIAKGLDVALHVVHSWMPHSINFGSAGEPPIDYAAYAAPAARILREQVDQLKQRGISVAGEHLVMGLAPGETSDLASNLGVQLIVTGGRGLGLVRRLLLGSVSQGVVREAEVPVLVVPERVESWPPDRIVVGFDASEASLNAATMSSAIARAIGAELIIATVITDARFRATMPGTAAAAAEDLAGAMAHRLSEEFGIPVQTAVLGGQPAHELLSLAAALPPAMLAMGSRGLGTLPRLATGSQSLAVLHGARGPVLISHATNPT